MLVTHHNVVRLFKATEAWFNFDEHDVWTLFHSYAFDFSVWELWGALAYGGRLVVVAYLVSRSPEAFYDLLRRERVTVLNQTPSAFHQLMEAEAGAGAADKLALRYVIFGGEALELKSLRPWFERHGDERPQLVNMYGITETTVHVTHRPLTMADMERSTGSVIGRRIPDLQVYALDRHLQPVPVGVPGELYIGGAGVARGYLNRAELTDERFIADPFSGKTQGRLYKSGDLGRYWPDGDIEYLGRIDQQVKIRGFRIELGEIEVALLQHPAIEQVVVVAREDEPGDKRLVAYVVAQEGPAPTVSEIISRMKGKVPQHLMADADVQKAPLPDVSELRGFLKEKLPEYMVPSAFVMLHELPLTPNGKVDRRALPVPDQERPELERAFLAPRDTLELQLTKMWEKVLGVEPIGVKDNFFDLGGHSLLAVRLFAQIEKSFGRNLPLATLFQAPTIEQLADILRQQGWTSRWSSLVPIQPGGSKPPFYCMHAGGGQVFFYRDLAHRLGPDQPFYGLQIRTLNGVQMPHTT
ncbi:MAG TPA: AMP-binding protein, partial [Gemmatimonadaceae bacterium]|nr:AMP-binding protein [Gemmatimonadaceae bacterium]